MATILLLPIEIYELSVRVSVLKIITLALNLLIAGYLLWAKRLFGVHGGYRAERRRRERDSGWPAVDAATTALVGPVAVSEGADGPAGPGRSAGGAP